jgi:hypothetical protein
MKAQTVNGGRRAQEYLACGAVITAAGIMFMAGSLQLTQSALMYSRWGAITLAVVGVFLMGAGLGMRRMPAVVATTKKPAAAKATTTRASTTKKRSGKK